MTTELTLYTILQKRISNFTEERIYNLRQENRLNRFLDMLNAQNRLPIDGRSLKDIETGRVPIEENINMVTYEADIKPGFKVVLLPAMRAVYNIAVGISPERCELRAGCMLSLKAAMI